MTNTEFAEVLERLAEHYRADETLEQLKLYLFLNTKEELRATIKSIGGKWDKRGFNAESEHASLWFHSLHLEPLAVCIPRSAVCRKTVTYDCDPIMSPAEEVEILQEAV
jgi:hypothetical protein